MRPKKLTHREQMEQSTLGHRATTGPLEFSSAEQLLRHDASQTTVPPGVARRLAESVASQPPPKPWWRRLFQGEA